MTRKLKIKKKSSPQKIAVNMDVKAKKNDLKKMESLLNFSKTKFAKIFQKKKLAAQKFQ